MGHDDGRQPSWDCANARRVHTEQERDRGHGQQCEQGGRDHPDDARCEVYHRKRRQRQQRDGPRKSRGQRVQSDDYPRSVRSRRRHSSHWEDLLDDDDDANAAHEAGDHRIGNVANEAAETHQAHHHLERAHQQEDADDEAKVYFAVRLHGRSDDPGRDQRHWGGGAWTRARAHHAEERGKYA